MKDWACGLSELEQRLLITLEQTVHREGLTAAQEYGVHLGRCPTVILPQVSAAFESLTRAGYVEALMQGSRSAALACCVPALKRSYRLTEKGHEWKCENHRRITAGLYLPPEHP